MARYKVLEASFIENKLVEKGDEVEYTGEPGANLELITGRRKIAEGEDANGTVYKAPHDGSADDLA